MTPDVCAVDALLDPDETMVRRAKDVNARLLGAFPEGFALDEAHAPHVSCLKRYVKTASLDDVYEAVERILSSESPTSWKLTAHKYYYIPYKGLGLAGIVIVPTTDLIRFQQKLIDEIAPFTLKTGTAAAYVTTREDPDIVAPVLDYVANFVPHETGRHFNPHVTVGIAPEDYLRRLLREKFEPFTFTPSAVAVYHLGNFGTAAKKLKGWPS